MSLSARSNTIKKSARLARIKSVESRREISSYLKKSNWNPKLSEKSEWDFTDRFVKGQCLAYIIMGGNPGYFLLKEEDKKQAELASNLAENLWGEEEHPIKKQDQDLLGKVIANIEWEPTDEKDLISLVNFTNSLPNRIKHWEIQFSWKEWKETGRLNFRGEKELTTEMPPLLRSYSFDVRDVSGVEVIRKISNSIPLMGIELEFSYTGRLDELLPVLSMGIFKRDSTTDVEFVSVPIESGELIEELEKRGKSFGRMLKENGTETNGMHVHVSRNQITLGQQSRMLYLLNAQKNRTYWSKIADRDVKNNEYCRFIDLSRQLVNAVKRGNYSLLLSDDFPKSRNKAINLTKESTIEFRLFKSPDNLKKVIKNIKIVQSVLDYTAQGGYNLKGFREFLSEVEGV